MSFRKVSHVEKIDFVYHYRDQRINYSVWSNVATGKLDTIIYLGTVQIGKIPAWVTSSCPPNTIVIQGLPHWFAQDDGSDIPELLVGFMANALDEIVGMFKVAKVNIIAESQAATGAIRLFNMTRYSKYLKNLILLQPLGLNAGAYPGTDKERIEIFKKRITNNARYQYRALFTDGRLRYNHAKLLKRVNLNNAKTASQYNSGLVLDVTPELKAIVDKSFKTVIISGTNDQLFPPNEIINNLQACGVDVPVILVDGVPHSSLATKLGRKLLQEAFHHI